MVLLASCIWSSQSKNRAGGGAVSQNHSEVLSTDQRTMHGFAVLIIELEIGGKWNIGLGTVGCQVGLKAGCKTKCGCTPGNRTLSNQWAASSAAVGPMVKLSSCRALTVAC